MNGGLQCSVGRRIVIVFCEWGGVIVFCEWRDSYGVLWAGG